MTITDEVLKIKAEEFSSPLHLEITDRWLLDFKDQHDIRSYQVYDVPTHADPVSISLARSSIRAIIRRNHFKWEDIYNFDEAGLFWRAKPAMALATGGAWTPDVWWIFIEMRRIDLSRGWDDRFALSVLRA